MCQNIAVFFGGVSSENEISVITGTMVCNVLKRGGMKVLPVYITQSGQFMCGENLSDIKNFSSDKLPSATRIAFIEGGIAILSGRGKIKKRLPIACAVNCCHGGWGEGGGLSGLCQSLSIPFASAGTFESSLFIDKYLTKIILKGLGVPTVEYCYLTESSSKNVTVDFPVMVKPVHLGSSIGVIKAENPEELKAALASAFTLDSAVIVERYITNRREINCAACLRGKEIVTSLCEEVFGGDILSYDDKYSGASKRVFPADLPPAISENIRNITSFVYSSLGMRGIVRFDFILEEDSVYLSEVNTVPGSLSQHLLTGNFGEMYELLKALICQSREEFERNNSKMLINTGIINNFTSNTCKIK